jgi:molybdenum cofactor cytidylyltransferase
MDIQKIFEAKPMLWGLRGDPYLWDALKSKAVQQTNFASDKAFAKFLESTFELLVGQKLDEGKIYYVKEFDHGGMSRGGISCDFWLKTGFPTLIKNFNLLTQEGIKILLCRMFFERKLLQLKL